jgi:DtxR family Mn-dependent transcriptional regulator
MQTHSEENYLKAIYKISSQNQGKASLKTIADVLGNNPASVIDMMKKLSDKLWIDYDKSKGAVLTDEGQRLALQIIRKHRLWEVFLKEKLNYNWAQVHEIAEQLEHIRYADLADRLDSFLGYPAFDPHGDPIPDSEGKLPVFVKKNLNEAETDKVYKVIAVADTSSDFLQYLQQLNISIGCTIKICERYAFDGSLLIEINAVHKVSVSKIFADNLWII